VAPGEEKLILAEVPEQLPDIDGAFGTGITGIGFEQLSFAPPKLPSQDHLYKVPVSEISLNEPELQELVAAPHEPFTGLLFEQLALLPVFNPSQDHLYKVPVSEISLNEPELQELVAAPHEPFTGVAGLGALQLKLVVPPLLPTHLHPYVVAVSCIGPTQAGEPEIQVSGVGLHTPLIGLGALQPYTVEPPPLPLQDQI